MRRISTPQGYSESNYDHFYCLKPPLLLWLAVFYLSRAITLPLIVGIGSFAGVAQDATSSLRDLWSADSLIPSFIAGAVLCAFFRRLPSATGLIRWIWAHGHQLLAFAAGADAVASLTSAGHREAISHQVLASLVAAAADVYLLSYVLLSRRVRDTFAEFPNAGLAEK